MTGSHEVSGSIPLISTKTKSHSERNGFLFCMEVRGARSLRFDRSDFAACKRRIFARNAQKSKENPTGTEQAQLAEYPAYPSTSLSP